MSNELVGRCWLIDFPTSAMKLVMMKLADCADDDGTNVFPSVAYIARETLLSTRSVSDQIAALRECGLVADRKDEHGNRVNRTSVLREINIDLMAAVSDRRVRGKPRVPSEYVITQVEFDVPAGATQILVPGALAASTFREPAAGGARRVWAIMPRPAEAATPATGAGADGSTPAAGSGVPLQQVQGTPATGADHPCDSCQQPIHYPSNTSSPLPPADRGGRESEDVSETGKGAGPAIRSSERERGREPAAPASALRSAPAKQPRSVRQAEDKRGLCEWVLAAIRTPERERAIAVLIEPLVRLRRIDAQDVPFALAQMAEWAAKHPDYLLAEARDRILAARDVTVKPADIEKHLRAAIARAKAEAEIAANGKWVTGTAQFRAALAAVRAVKPLDAELMANWNVIRPSDLAALGIDPGAVGAAIVAPSGAAPARRESPAQNEGSAR